MPKLTIITINYNNLEGLKRTMDSVVNQTWKGFEYLVIDGGSTDGSAAFIESQSANINYWVSEPDKGIYNAMNKGIIKATGEYLLFLNSGDHFYSNNVLLENHTRIADYDLIYFNLNVVVGETSYIKTYPDTLLFSYFIKDTLPHQATFIRATLFDKLGMYDESLKIISDWKFFMETIFKFNATYSKKDIVLSTFYFDGISSDTANSKLINEERQNVLKTAFKGYVDEINELVVLRIIVSNFRKSRIIKLLIKLGLLNKF